MTDIVFTYNDPPKKEAEFICRQLGLDKLFGEGSCVVMNIRRYGGMKVL